MSDSDPAKSEGKPDAVRPAGFGGVARAFGIFLLAVAAAVCGGLIAIYWPWPMGGTSDAALNSRVGALETRISQIGTSHGAANSSELTRSVAALKARLDADEAKLVELEKSPASANGADGAALKAALDKNAADIAALQQQTEKLAQAVQTPNPQLAGQIADNQKALAALRGDLEAQTKTATDALDKLDTGVAALQARVSDLEKRDVAGLVQRASAMLALADLVRATEGEAPFANELDALRALVPNAPELADLSKYARNGVPTHATLAARFKGKIDSILAAERDARAHNWAERIWAEIVGLVSVRRVGNVAGNDTEARLARAEFALEHGDLTTAVTEVQRLDKPAKDAAMPWLRDAEARLAVNRDAHVLTNRIVGAMAQQAGAKP